MAKNKKETVDKKNEKQEGSKRSFKISKQQKFVLGCLLVLFSVLWNSILKNAKILPSATTNYK